MSHPTRLLIAAVAATVALAGCKTAPQQQQPQARAGCKPLPGTEKPDTTKATVIGGVVGAVAGAAIGGSVANKGAVGRRNGALFGAVAGALAGNAYAKSIGMSEEADGSVKLNVPGSVLFPTGSAQLAPSFKSTLDTVAGTIKEYCGVTGQVVGHTDNTGTYAINSKLSLERAQSVVAYLNSQGVEMNRLSADGRADSQPVAPNTDEAGRAQNRRVEIFLRPPAP